MWMLIVDTYCFSNLNADIIELICFYSPWDTEDINSRSLMLNFFSATRSYWSALHVWLDMQVFWRFGQPVLSQKLLHPCLFYPGRYNLSYVLFKNVAEMWENRWWEALNKHGIRRERVCVIASLGNDGLWWLWQGCLRWSPSSRLQPRTETLIPSFDTVINAKHAQLNGPTDQKSE